MYDPVAVTRPGANILCLSWLTTYRQHPWAVLSLRSIYEGHRPGSRARYDDGAHILEIMNYSPARNPNEKHSSYDALPARLLELSAGRAGLSLDETRESPRFARALILRLNCIFMHTTFVVILHSCLKDRESRPLVPHVML